MLTLRHLQCVTKSTTTNLVFIRNISNLYYIRRFKKTEHGSLQYKVYMFGVDVFIHSSNYDLYDQKTTKTKTPGASEAEIGFLFRIMSKLHSIL